LRIHLNEHPIYLSEKQKIRFSRGNFNPYIHLSS
jgi:hypothetical protein